MKKKKHDILVLNRAYVPLHIIDWMDGIKMLYKDHCHALDNDYISYNFNTWKDFSMSSASEDYAKIQTVSYPVAVPEIVSLVFYDRLPDREVKYTRQSVIRTYKCVCSYCGKTFPERELELEHVIPKSFGGTATWQNIVPACKGCNNRKANRTPQQAGMPLLVKPHRPKWINPLTNVQWENHPCKSWSHFIHRV